MNESDPDAGTQNLSFSASVSNGTLNLDPDVFGGMSVSVASGAQVTGQGSTLGINRTLSDPNGLLYTAPSAFRGCVNLTISVDDLGNSGSGGSAIGSDEVCLLVGSAYDLWLHEEFGRATVEDPRREATVWGVEADPNEDGIGNLASFYHGIEPRERNRDFPHG